MSKVGKMRAIHNRRSISRRRRSAVVTMSKVGKMRAIHNDGRLTLTHPVAVVTMSKVGKMRAIHNFPFPYQTSFPLS